MSTAIVMLCPCCFVDDKGQKVEYYRALVRASDKQGGVKYTLEKCCKDIKGLDDISLSCDCSIFYDRYGRICSVASV